MALRSTMLLCSPALAACALLGCQVEPVERFSETKSRSHDAKQAPGETSVAAEPPKRQKVSGPRAYVSVGGAGVFALDSQGWRSFYEGRNRVRSMELLFGRLHTLTNFGITRINPDGSTAVVLNFDPDSAEALGDPRQVIGDGQWVWVLGGNGVGRWSETWSIHSLEELEFGRDRDSSLAIDPERKPVLLAPGQGLRRNVDGQWQPLEPTEALASRSNPRYTAMVTLDGCEPGDETQSCRLTRVTKEGSTQHTVLVPSCEGAPELALSSNGGHIALGTSCGTVVADLGKGGSAPVVSRSEGWPGHAPKSLAVDDSGRAWAGTNHGLVLVAVDGTVSFFPIAGLSEVAGPIDHLIVSGAGPNPPTLGPERRAGLEGSIVAAGEGHEPIAGATLRICGKRPLAGEVPCEGVEGARTVETGQDGGFEAEQLVLDHYYLWIERDGRWIEAVPKTMSMREGMHGNIGAAVLTPAGAPG